MTDPSARRPPGPWRRAAPWLVAALVLATIGVPASAAALRVVRVAPEIGYAVAESTLAVPINMTDAPAFVPSGANVPAGATVAFTLQNQGNYSHSFTLSAVPNFKLSPSWTPTQVDAFFQQNGSLANVTVAPHSTASANVSFPATDALDAFEFVSIVPYQFQAGMSGVINVTSTGPGLEVQEGTVNTPAFVPNELAANASHFPVVVNVLVTNQGTLPHTFTVVPQSNVTITYSNFTSYFQQHAPLANVNVPASTGGSVWANFTVGAAGIYMYICEIPGHFQAGMFGLLYVGIPPPPAPPAPSTAIVQGWILVGAGALLAVGISLAAVTAYVGRFPSEPKGPHGGHGP
ncbi:MAG TPA: hypothetical protein VMG99_02885 [Thermoplasmata archaeon]|nr:hypothetical protein [Thermoplasmata archaeon]